jgi:hypothetical protein
LLSLWLLDSIFMQWIYQLSGFEFELCTSSKAFFLTVEKTKDPNNKKKGRRRRRRRDWIEPITPKGQTKWILSLDMRDFWERFKTCQIGTMMYFDLASWLLRPFHSLAPWSCPFPLPKYIPDDIFKSLHWKSQKFLNSKSLKHLLHQMEGSKTTQCKESPAPHGKGPNKEF